METDDKDGWPSAVEPSTLPAGEPDEAVAPPGSSPRGAMEQKSSARWVPSRARAAG